MVLQELPPAIIPLSSTTVPIPRLLPTLLHLPLTAMVLQELPPPIPDPTLSQETPIRAKRPLPTAADPLPTQELLLPPTLPLTTATQDPLEQTTIRTAALQDLQAAATARTTTKATPDPLTATPTTEVTATHIPDRLTITIPTAIPTILDRLTALPEVIQDPPTALPTTQAAEAAVHTPDPLVVQAAIQDLQVVQAAIQDLQVVQEVFQEAVVPQEAPSPEAVQEAMLQEDKSQIWNTKQKSISLRGAFFSLWRL